MTSSEALDHLGLMLDDKARAALRDRPLFVPHRRIAELAHLQGWRQVLLTGAGDDGLVSGLVAWAKQRTENREQCSGTGSPGNPI